MPVTLIADDLTGACDAGALFAGRGRVGVFVDAPVRPGWDVAAVDTETRELSAASAAERTRAAVARCESRVQRGVLFKKIDSTLRGAVGAELDAVLDATGIRRALVCPAFPAQGRTVVAGELRVHGVACHRSPVGCDPSFTAGTSDVAAILAWGSPRPALSLSVAHVRGDADALRAAIRRFSGGWVVADAETDADLDALAAAALDSPDTVLAGSAGLARAVAVRLGHWGPPVPLPEACAWLVVAGSMHPASRAQIRALADAGVAGLIVADQAPCTAQMAARLRDGQPAFLTTPDCAAAGTALRRQIAASLAAAARRVLAESRPDLVVVTGGDTAHAVLVAVGADHLALRGSPGSGLALADVTTSGGLALTWLTKAGAFGPPDLWLSLLKGSA